MIHRFIEGTVIEATDKGMLELNPKSYDRKFKVLLVQVFDKYNPYVELLHIDTNEKFAYGGSRLFEYFDGQLQTPNINHEIHKLLETYKFKSFSAVDVQGKIFQIDIP